MKETRMVDEDGIPLAAEIIKKGGLVAFPTETVYGLGANALDPEAAKKIYAAKGRPSDNPLIVHVVNSHAAEPLTNSITQKARKLMDDFWPGPLTIILKKSDLVPNETTGGLDTVALRCPEHKIALRFLEECGVPVAAPSANISGHPSPTLPKHVLDDLNGKIDIIIDGGEVGIGIESTIIDLSGDKPTLLRPGAISVEELSASLGQEVKLDPSLLLSKDKVSITAAIEDIHPKAPGMKYRHYAPKAKMLIVSAIIPKIPASNALIYNADLNNSELEKHKDELVADRINEEARISVQAGNRVGILCCEETKDLYRTGYGNIKVNIKTLGTRENPASMARNLFKKLREFDEENVEEIFAESYPEKGIGFALMNRLRKAAGMNEIFVEEP